MPSDELFPEMAKAGGWEGLEKRVNRLLESVVQLRSSNGQLMKENMALKNQLKDKPDSAPPVSPATEKLRKDYEQALADLKALQANLARMEELASKLRNGEKHG